jgi:DNA topoisomerase IB
MRLRRSDPSGPGYGRRRRGRGATFIDSSGRPLTDADEVRRCRELAIPPAWRDVWICSDPCGHLQATGIDAAGRRQYLYHPQWRTRRERRKFSHVLEIAAHLPRLRRRVARDLGTGGLTRDRVLALAARLLDRGLFRVGGDEYASGDDPTFGAATLRADHVRLNSGGTAAAFCYLAKGGAQRELTIADRAVVSAIGELKRFRRRDDRLLAYRDDDGWHELRAADVNDYLRVASGQDMTAKDLRTWHATVAAAVGLARAEPPRSATAARRVVAEVMRVVAADLGNTPAIARSSYVDPQVVDLYLRGETVPLPSRRDDGPAVEAAVLDSLTR